MNKKRNQKSEKYDQPENRVGRWTNSELTNLKLAMTIFGD